MEKKKREKKKKDFEKKNSFKNRRELFLLARLQEKEKQNGAPRVPRPVSRPRDLWEARSVRAARAGRGLAGRGAAGRVRFHLNDVFFDGARRR